MSHWPLFGEPDDGRCIVVMVLVIAVGVVDDDVVVVSSYIFIRGSVRPSSRKMEKNPTTTLQPI